jgi:hypothetical protein
VNRDVERADQQENIEGGVVYQQGVREQGMWVEGGIHRTVRVPIIVPSFIELAIKIMVWPTQSHRFEK